MEEGDVRERATALCSALVSGDIERVTEDFSTELRGHLGDVLALLPLPSSAATIESIEHGGSAYAVVLKLVGETEEVLIQTRWKERDGRPTVIEVSHLSTLETAAHDGEVEGETDGGVEGAGEAAT